jgi:hypothetical protein
MIRRLLPLGIALLAVLATTDAAQAQLRPGIHVARATARGADVGGTTNGVGGSLELGLPLAPVDLFVAGDYFFPDCTGDCSLWGGSADLHFKMPVPVLTPYGAVGLVWRRSSFGDVTQDAQGFALGAGVDLGTIALGAYFDARYEFVDPDDQMVLRLGIRF